MAKLTLPFMYRQSIEWMQQILLECWARHRKDGNLYARRLALDCHKEIFNQAANGVSVLAVKKITGKANALGIEWYDITLIATIIISWYRKRAKF